MSARGAVAEKRAIYARFNRYEIKMCVFFFHFGKFLRELYVCFLGMGLASARLEVEACIEPSTRLLKALSLLEPSQGFSLSSICLYCYLVHLFYKM
ncbi:hypothetical protein BKA65DRAFT_248333 [Rhexocercosporidium sp. MPI-PUGE-AT-0058]|nr:hypothetical protein BKA65DRAFT_248333 [Rhexocercosporidium sp. MPI-PUGE-AT-0058]